MPSKKVPTIDPLPHPHFGAFCRHVRETLAIDIQSIALKYNISHAKISRNFERIGTLPTEKDFFKNYMEGLQSREFSERGLALDEDNVNIMNSMWDFENDKNYKEEIEINLNEIKIESIKDNPDRKLREMITKLQRFNAYPAWICDSFGVIHATNGAMWHLFNVLNEKPNYLDKWTAWNVQATKYYYDSPLRIKQLDYADYLPQSLAVFFHDTASSGLLFTSPMKKLIKEILLLSDPYGLRFRQFWLGVTSFTLPKRESSTRAIKDPTNLFPEPIRFIADKANYHYKSSGVFYKYGEWIPLDEEAKRVIEDLRKRPKYYDIFYAADYQSKSERPFHPVQW